MSTTYDRFPIVDTQRYKIVRMFRDSSRTYTIARGLTLQETQAHCSNPETSSSTCAHATGNRRTRQHGPWFDGYEKD